MKKVSFPLMATVAILFAAGSAFAYSTTLSRYKILVNANGSVADVDGPDNSETETVIYQSNTAINFYTYVSDNITCQSPGILQCVAYADGNQVLDILYGFYEP